MRRTILLPSNGLEYPSIAALKPPSNRDVLALASTSFSSVFEYYSHVVSIVAETPGISPGEMLVSDMYFIYLYTFLFLFPQDDDADPFFPAFGICQECGAAAKVRLHPDKLEYKYRNPFDWFEHPASWTGHGFCIRFGRRRVIDNLTLATVFGDQYDDPLAVMRAYVATSARAITADGEENVPRGEWFQAMDNMSEEDLINAYASASAFNSRGFGLSRYVSYRCECGADAKTLLFNDVMLTSSSTPVPRHGDPSEMLKGMINTARFKVASYDEIMSQPATETRHFSRALSGVQFVPTMAGLA